MLETLARMTFSIQGLPTIALTILGMLTSSPSWYVNVAFCSWSYPWERDPAIVVVTHMVNRSSRKSNEHKESITQEHNEPNRILELILLCFGGAEMGSEIRVSLVGVSVSRCSTTINDNHVMSTIM